jgi:UTP--glucose-1-phosphate uridylyltransferase
MPSSQNRVRKVVLPVAGLGTRFLPVTKTIPKEMLPIVDIPTVQLNVEECVASGIEEVIFVNARGKQSIEDHFDRAGELEALLEKRGKTADLEAIRRVSAMAKFISVRQAEAKGLGHAVLCAREAVGDEPFAVLLGDDLLESQRPGLRQLIDIYERWGQGVIALKEVPVGQEHLYGIIEGSKVAERDWQLKRLVEKPAPGTAPSRLAIIGRYVLPPEIFEILELTDALEVLCQRRGLHGLEVEGLRFDAGDRAGYVLAVLYYALRRKDIGADVKAGARRLLDELG